jgi:hypothetical protein
MSSGCPSCSNKQQKHRENKAIIEARTKLPRLCLKPMRDWRASQQSWVYAYKSCLFHQMEQNDSVRAPISHKPQLYSFPMFAHHHCLISLLYDHCLSPRPPAQDDCKQIEDVSAPRSLSFQSLSLTPLLLTYGQRQSGLAATARH